MGANNSKSSSGAGSGSGGFVQAGFVPHEPSQPPQPPSPLHRHRVDLSKFSTMLTAFPALYISPQHDQRAR